MAEWSDGTPAGLSGKKLRALIAILAISPQHQTDRTWLQDTLWGRSGLVAGQASLRQAISQLRKIFGDHFDDIFRIDRQVIGLHSDRFVVLPPESGAEFLAGMDIGEEGFEDWLRLQRAKPAQVAETNQTHTPLDIVSLLPTVLTLPFQSRMTQSDQAPLGDMLAQEVSRALSRSQFLSVISHLSARSVAHDQIDTSEIERKTGADYLICGTLQIEGQTMVAVVDLVDVHSGRILWTRDFRGDLAAFLAGQSELVWEIATHVGRGIVMGSLEFAASVPMPNVKSHTLLMSGIGLMHRQNRTGFELAKSQVQEVLSRAPHHSAVYAWLAKWHVLNVQQGWSDDEAKDARHASDYCKRALDRNSGCAFSLAVDGFVKNNLLRQLDDAAKRFDDAISIDPNNAFAWLLKGTLHAFEGHGAEAVKCTARARHLSPLDPYGYFFDSLSATACASAGDFDGALALANRSLAVNPRHASTLRVRTVSLEMLGRACEAQQAAQELLRITPDFTVKHYLEQHPAGMFKTGREWAKALISAGLPQH